MEAKKFISKVLADGHLSLPEDVAKELGKVFEVILVPFGETEVYSYAEALAKERGFSAIKEDDIQKIIHESRGVK
ncbi:MAG: hypothetical protein ABII74_07605 [Elusimicrobiota bacterium]